MSCSISIPDASKDGEIIKFTIQTKLNDADESGKIVLRQYEDFVYLQQVLLMKNNTVGMVVPPIPPKPNVIPSTSESKLKLKPTVSTVMSGDGYAQDCRRLEMFIQDLANHETFKDDENLMAFLTEEQAPARVNVKKGVFDSIVDMMDNARFHSYKDTDEDFQKKRDGVNSMLLQIKQCQLSCSRMVLAENTCTSQVTNLAMASRNCATFDIQHSKPIVRFLGQFADILDTLVEGEQKSSHVMDTTFGFSLELYTRYLTSCQATLFRRTCKLVEFDNAVKALEKAKPKNREQLLTAKEEASIALDSISETTKSEVELFHKNRVKHFRDSLSQLAGRQLDNHRNSCKMLSEAIRELKDIA